ncbi:AAA domain-containing protein [Clostridium sp.]
MRAQKDMEFRECYSKEIDRIENNEDISLFVKNIENVQGDERDVIIFSTGYGINENGRVSVNFGSLSKDGGENRLNVAISRAKQKIYVITSIEPEELKVEVTKNNGPKLFKKYLQYVREISIGDKEEANKILKSLLDSDIEVNTERKHESDFESEVYEGLVKIGYDVHTQVGVSGYKIDLAIYDKKSSRYILGIECDGATYHSSKSARERDVHRQKYLESRGWKITRIWSRNWWKNSKEELDKIVKNIQEVNKYI